MQRADSFPTKCLWESLEATSAVDPSSTHVPSSLQLTVSKGTFQEKQTLKMFDTITKGKSLIIKCQLEKVCHWLEKINVCFIVWPTWTPLAYTLEQINWTNRDSLTKLVRSLRIKVLAWAASLTMWLWFFWAAILRSTTWSNQSIWQLVARRTKETPAFSPVGELPEWVRDTIVSAMISKCSD